MDQDLIYCAQKRDSYGVDDEVAVVDMVEGGCAWYQIHANGLFLGV